MVKNISSLQNPLVKEILQLQEKSRARRKSGLFIIEGRREINLALKGGYELQTLLFSSEINDQGDIEALTKHVSEVIEISKEVYEKIAYRSSTEGLIAIAKTKDISLEALKFKRENPLILVTEAPEKPGNIGALLRTADAANLDAVIIANPKTDLFNPNIIRSSVGCVFTNAIATGSTLDVINFLKKNEIKIYAAELKASIEYQNCDFSQASAIVVGTEATGLSTEWLRDSDQNIIIPMQGEIDSMNVSVAAGILIFEAKRQRDFN